LSLFVLGCQQGFSTSDGNKQATQTPGGINEPVQPTPEEPAPPAQPGVDWGVTISGCQANSADFSYKGTNVKYTPQMEGSDKVIFLLHGTEGGSQNLESSPEYLQFIDAAKSQGSMDSYILKIDHSGEIIWSKTLGNEDYEGGGEIATSPEGDIFLTGNHAGSSYGLYSDQGRLEAEGALVWAESLNQKTGTSANGVVEFNNGALVVNKRLRGLEEALRLLVMSIQLITLRAKMTLY
jgi:hypothetical protein